MKEQFDTFERLYRAVYPPNIMPMFWKEKRVTHIIGHYKNMFFNSVDKIISYEQKIQ